VTIVEQHAKQPALPRTFRRESARLDERGVARLGRHLQPRGAQRVEFLHGRHVAAPLTWRGQAAPTVWRAKSRTHRRFRGLFQSAKALHLSGRRFDRVVLARSGKPVFAMTGDSFVSLGEELEAGQNPIFLIRTLPEKLHDPDGNPAFGRWEGGWLGVMGKQMEDVNQAARQWIGGDDVTKAGKA